MDIYTILIWMVGFTFLVATAGLVVGSIAVAGKGVAPSSDTDKDFRPQSNLYGGSSF